MPALVLGIIGYGADSVATQHELNRLLSRVTSTQATVGYSNRRISATVAYASPLLYSVRTPPQVAAGLRQLVQDEAAGQVPSLRAERERVVRAHVWWWHRSQLRAKAALVRYLDARITYLREVASSLQALYVDHPELRRLLDQARDAFTRAASGDRRRIDAAFAGGVNPG